MRPLSVALARHDGVLNLWQALFITLRYAISVDVRYNIEPRDFAVSYNAVISKVVLGTPCCPQLRALRLTASAFLTTTHAVLPPVQLSSKISFTPRGLLAEVFFCRNARQSVSSSSKLRDYVKRARNCNLEMFPEHVTLRVHVYVYCTIDESNENRTNTLRTEGS